jgi:hypothetical protein
MSAEILAYLKRIEAKLDAVLAKRQQEERLRPARPAENVASGAQLEGRNGDPKVRFKPRDWTGRDYKGCSFSETEPEFLDLLANALEYFADRKAVSDPQKASWDRLDAARARGWALRIRNGTAPGARANEPTAGPNYDFDDGEPDMSVDPNADIPF